MTRLPVWFFLAVSLTAAGCVDGGDIAADALREIDNYINSNFADQLHDIDPDADSDEDGEISEDEVDCDHPIFTTVEPFPPGGTTNVPEVITPGDSYYECVSASGLSGKLRLLPDGRVEGIYTSGYQDELAFWNLCQHGPEPPEFSGSWVYYPEYGAVCERDNIVPGVIACGGAYSDTYYLIHQGQEFAAVEAEEADCVYRE